MRRTRSCSSLPEYNGGFPVPLKNVVEWQHKPVSFASCGGVSAGTQAVQTNLRMLPVGPTVSIPFVNEHVEDGAFRPGKIHEAAAEQMLDELVRTAAVTSAARLDVLTRWRKQACASPSTPAASGSAGVRM